MCSRMLRSPREQCVAQSDIPEDVQRLLREHILSVEQLEILLLLRARRDSELDAKVISEELRTSETSASSRLADLEQRGFASRRQGPSFVLYKYAPNSKWLEDTVELLDSAYAERRYRVIELIFSKPIDNLRTYAGAFRFRKDESDG